MLPQQRRCLLGGEARIGGPQLGKLAPSPQPGQRQRRVGPAADGQVQLRRQVLQEEGEEVSHLHLRYLNPMPDIGAILKGFKQVLIPEMNLGQLAFMIRGTYLKDVVSYPKVQGKPFFRGEILAKIEALMESKPHVQ